MSGAESFSLVAALGTVQDEARESLTCLAHEVQGWTACGWVIVAVVTEQALVPVSTSKNHFRAEHEEVVLTRPRFVLAKHRDRVVRELAERADVAERKAHDLEVDIVSVRAQMVDLERGRAGDAAAVEAMTRRLQDEKNGREAERHARICLERDLVKIREQIGAKEWKRITGNDA